MSIGNRASDVLDRASALTTGSDGAIYVSGWTSGNLDGQTNSGSTDVFITKYQPDGTKIWTRLLGSTDSDNANALTTGNDGSIYVSGVTYGNFDGQNNSGNVFITKYQPDGTKVWTRTSEAVGSANALATGNDGAIYVAGYTIVNFDGQTLNNNGGVGDAFIIKYQPNGTKAWTRLLGSDENDEANALTIGNDGSIYVSGWTWGNLDGQINSGGKYAFITKYQPNGTKVWTRLLGVGVEDTVANALTTGSDGAIYVSGRTTGNLDGQTFSGGYEGDIFLTKYQPDGTKVWTKLLGTSSDDVAYALTTGSDGAIYVSGYTEGNLDGQGNLSGLSDVFITKYQPDGTKVWTQILGEINGDIANALTTGQDGAIYVSGTTFDSSGLPDVFVTKLNVNTTSRSFPDFNKDGKTDILLNNPSQGWNTAWLMDGTNYAGYASVFSSAGYKPVATADFNKDGKTDLVVNNPSNNFNSVWFMDGGNYVSGVGLPTAAGWQIKGAADFNGDGNTDILLNNTTTNWNTVWFLGGANGASYTGFGNLPVANGWNITGVADFNGDGNSDILLNNPSQGWNTVWFLNGTTYSGFANLPSAQGWQSLGTGDFNGDGKPDIILNNLNSNWNTVWLMNGTNYAGFANLPTAPAGWQIAGMA
ncbi:FG-GAP-like repeat-containing protein [Sphaerospermopsis torques-reginae ITEP-024]|uniref:FG-GAP-like repeat-containing protein n=2 Tax=Sphaerospermopsis TaxID=752201 RepID=A0ABX8X6Q9_9CYAN|nr:FG-GAP-like repeat-containing protein [Sphaerospermopsis torques-reginae ITEP-024]